MTKVFTKEIAHCHKCPYSWSPDLREDFERGIYCTFKSKEEKNQIRIFPASSYFKLIAKGLKAAYKATPPDFCPLPNKEINNA